MKKKLLSLALALAFCLGLAVPVSAAGTTKVVVDETHGVKITMDGFLRMETRRYNSNIYYDSDTDEPDGGTVDLTIYVVADNSTVTVEALEGRKYADPSFWEAMKDLDRWDNYEEGTPEYEAFHAFLDDIDQYAWEDTRGYSWQPEYNDFHNHTSGRAWPLEKAVTETVSPAESITLEQKYEVSWLCESDYAQLAPAVLQASGWAQPEVERAYDAGIVPFSPYLKDCTKGMTRGDFAAVTVWLYAAMLGENPDDLDVSTKHPFIDVYWETTSFENEISMAYNLGFVKGKQTALFKPNDTLTRQEAAVMLGRVYTKVYGGIPTVANTAFADDQDVAGWAKSEVAFMSGKEIVKGVGGNRFAPKKTLSIQESVIMANRMLENLN